MSEVLQVVKDAASHQLEAVGDASSVLGDCLKNSIHSGTKEAGRLASSLSELFDVEDLLKSIRNVTSSDSQDPRRTSIVHEPIDWSKYPPSAFRRGSGVPGIHHTSTVINEDLDDDMDNNDNQQRNQVPMPCSRKQSKRKFTTNPIASKTTSITTHEKFQRQRRSSAFLEQKLSNEEESTDFNSVVESIQLRLKPDKSGESHMRISNNQPPDYNSIVESMQSKFKSDVADDQKKKKLKSNLKVDHKVNFILPSKLSHPRRSSHSQFGENGLKDNFSLPKNLLEQQQQKKQRNRSASVVEFTGFGRVSQTTSTPQMTRRKKSELYSSKQ